MHDANFWREKLRPYTVKSNSIATWQVLNTLIPFILLWIGYAFFVEVSVYFAIPFALVISFFILRSFVLMHDCGHRSLFKSKRANQLVGFSLGVITGMPQAVWSRNHTYHHNTNGDWVKYRGVFNILSTDKYDKLPKSVKRHYWLFRQPLILIPAGFFYVLLNPRFSWFFGTLLMLWKIGALLMTFRFSEAVHVANKWDTRFWKDKKDYLHMTYNNIVLLSIWVVMCMTTGVAEFFILYVISTSLAGSIGILLFTIQHNFEDSYATDTAHVNHYRAALEGTSMLVLPKFLNWFTADIAYHHLHRLSVAIPNYRLAACHNEFASLFASVKRVCLNDALQTFNYQLWSPEQQKIVPKY